MTGSRVRIDGRQEELLCDRLRLSVAGVVIDLEFGHGLEGLAREMHELWSHLATPKDDAPVHARRTYVAEPTSQLPNAAVLRWVPASSYVLSKQVTKMLIENLIGSCVLLHAGFVDHNKFGGLMVVGASGAGKSTATTLLGQNGLYLTDELAIIDPASLQVAPFPKPVSRISPGAPASTKSDVALAELGLEAATRSAAIQHVVFLDRERATRSSTVDGPVIRRVSLAESLCRLVEQSSSLWKVKDGLSQLAVMITNTGGAVRVHYREAEQLPSLLAQLPPRRSEAWVRIERGPERIAGLGEYSVAQYVQALGVEDGVIVLSEGRVSHLSGLAGVIWAVLNERGPSSASDVERDAVSSLGAYEGSGRLVRDALSALLEKGAVIRGLM